MLFAVRRWTVVVDAPRVRLPQKYYSVLDLLPRKTPSVAVAEPAKQCCTSFSVLVFPFAPDIASSPLLHKYPVDHRLCLTRLSVALTVCAQQLTKSRIRKVIDRNLPLLLLLLFSLLLLLL